MEEKEDEGRKNEGENEGKDELKGKKKRKGIETKSKGKEANGRS